MMLIRLKIRNPGDQEGHEVWINKDKILVIHDLGKSYCSLEMENREPCFFIDDDVENVVNLLTPRPSPSFYEGAPVTVCKS